MKARGFPWARNPSHIMTVISKAAFAFMHLKTLSSRSASGLMRIDSSVGVSGSSAFFDGESYVFAPLLQDIQFKTAFSVSLWFLKKG